MRYLRFVCTGAAYYIFLDYFVLTDITKNDR